MAKPKVKTEVVETVKVELSNCLVKDARFIRELMALFADPANRMLLQELREGKLCLSYNPSTGGLFLFDSQENCIYRRN
jgi:hypothetical protein